MTITFYKWILDLYVKSFPPQQLGTTTTATTSAVVEDKLCACGKMCTDLEYRLCYSHISSMRWPCWKVVLLSEQTAEAASAVTMKTPLSVFQWLEDEQLLERYCMNHLKLYASFSTTQFMCLSCVGLTNIDVSFTMSLVADYIHSEKQDQQKTDQFYSFSVTCETII